MLVNYTWLSPSPRRSPRMDGATVSSSRTCRRCREWMKNVNGKDPDRNMRSNAGWLTGWVCAPLPLPRSLWKSMNSGVCIRMYVWPVSKERVIHAGMNCLRFATVSQPLATNYSYCTGYVFCLDSDLDPWPDPCTTRQRHGGDGEMFSFANKTSLVNY